MNEFEEENRKNFNNEKNNQKYVNSFLSDPSNFDNLIESPQKKSNLF